MRLFVLPPLVLAAACLPATSYQMRGPDGDMWWSIECRRSQANCYEEAGRRCPEGYEVADSSGHTSGSYAVATSPYSATVIHHYRGEMLVKCR